MSSYLSIHGGKTIIFHHPTSLIIIIFRLLLYVAEMFSSLIDRERRPIRIEFLTLQGKPNIHAWGAKSPTQHFPFLLVSQDRPTALDYKYDDSATADGGVVCPTPRSNQVLKLTDYHISRHVISTFKRLTNCTTHCGLSIFTLNRRSNYIVPWLCP